MAHKKAGGSSTQRPRFRIQTLGRQGLWRPEHQSRRHYRAPARHSIPQRRERGLWPDHTLFAKADGKVVFEVKGANNRKYVSVEPA